VSKRGKGKEQRAWSLMAAPETPSVPKVAVRRGVSKAALYRSQREVRAKGLAVPAGARKRDEFILRFKNADPKARATLSYEWERLVTLFDRPHEHGMHLRTANIGRPPFNAVRLRTDASRRFRKAENAETMICRLILATGKSWRAMSSPHLRRGMSTLGSGSRTELPGGR